LRAEDFLNQVKKLDKLIENKQTEKEDWKEKALKITTTYTNGDKIQTSGSQQKMADAVCKYVDLEKEIDKDIDKLIDAKKDVISVIENLNADEYDVIHKIYIQYYSLLEVSAMCKMSYNWTKSKHRKALKRIQEILDKREDN